VKRRVAIVSRDAVFEDRFQEAMGEQYKEELEFFSFPNPKKALTAARRLPLDLILADDWYGPDSEGEADWSLKPESCRILFMTEAPIRQDLELWNDSLRTCKYQNTDVWYDLIEQICEGQWDRAALDPPEAETLPPEPEDPPIDMPDPADWDDLPDEEEEEDVLPEPEESVIPPPRKHSSTRTHAGKVVLFTAAAGGVGTSTAAAAFAVHCARNKKVPLYLNLETFSSTESYFTNESNFTFEDILLALRSDRYEKTTLLRRAMCRDLSGVFTVVASPAASDLFSLTGEEIVRLWEWFLELDKFDLIVVDMNMDASERVVLPFYTADRTVIVTNGSVTANRKTERLLSTIPTISNLDRREIAARFRLLYNRYPAKNGRQIKGLEVGKLGGIHEIPCRTERALVRAISPLSPFARLEEDLHV